jgi:cell division protein ZapA
MDSGAPDKQSVRVTIYGQSYNLRASGGAAETAALAARVDELMSAIASRAGTNDPARVAVLACLHLTDRVQTLERQVAHIQEWCSNKPGTLSAMLDEVIEPGPSPDTAEQPR